jgi:hypothetical protein
MEKATSQLQTEMANYHIDNKGILHIEQKGVEITDEIIEGNYRSVSAFLEKKKYAMFCDATDSLPIDKKARLAFEVQSEEYCLALAIVSDSVLGRAVTNVFFALTKSTFPMKLFKEKQEALTWLEQQT